MSFAENPENYDSLMMAQRIDTQLQSCIALEQKLGALDREMALDPRYVHRVGIALAKTYHYHWPLSHCGVFQQLHTMSVLCL